MYVFISLCIYVHVCSYLFLYFSIYISNLSISLTGTSDTHNAGSMYLSEGST